MSTTDIADKYAAQACYDESNMPIARAGFMAGWNAANLEADRLRDGIKAFLTSWTSGDAKTHDLITGLWALLDGEAGYVD